MPEAGEGYDVLIIGGGPGGATAALKLAQAGLRVAVFDRASFPRFHIGETMVPYVVSLMASLGLTDRYEALNRVPKLGAEFNFAGAEDAQSLLFHFKDALLPGVPPTFNIERAPFDAMLLDAARDAGACVFEDARVDEVVRLGHGDTALRVGDRTFAGRWLLDASGQASLVGRHLGTRRVVESLRNVAYFGHFQHVRRLPGDLAGFPTIAMADEGWMWLIPINDTVTSCGLVLEAGAARRVGVPANRMLRWGIERCPLIRRRMEHAVCPEHNGTIADFSFRCEPYAGPGYFLLGDAATFVDPIFSTGVCLAMASAVEAADQLLAVDHGRSAPRRAAARYRRFLHRTSRLLFAMVHDYYQHPFRELMMNGSGPMNVHKAVISLLAGQVFPRPPWAVTWRYRLLQGFMHAQRVVPLVKRHPRHSLLHATPDPLPESRLTPAPPPDTRPRPRRAPRTPNPTA